MLENAGGKIARLIFPAVIAVCVASPFAAAQVTDSTGPGSASEGALALPAAAVATELSGRTPRPPKPKPGGGSSGYVWGTSGSGDLAERGDRRGEPRCSYSDPNPTRGPVTATSAPPAPAVASAYVCK